VAGAPKRAGAVARPAPKPGPAVQRAAVPEPERREPAGEPVWLVRTVIVLFLVGFAAFLAREVRGLLDATAVTRGALYWSGVGFGLLVGLVVGIAVALAVKRR
jgi:hypothetical protein